MDISDGYLKAFGRITLEFAKLEAGLDSMISILIDYKSQVGEIIAAQLSFKRKTEVLDSLVRYKVSDKALYDRMHQALGKAVTL